MQLSRLNTVEKVVETSILWVGVYNDLPACCKAVSQRYLKGGKSVTLWQISYIRLQVGFVFGHVGSGVIL